MKFEHTDNVNLKIHPKSRIYYYVRGAHSESLKTTDEATARARLGVIDALREFSGEKAQYLKNSPTIEKYLEHRRKQRDGELPKTKKISAGTYKEMVDIFRLHLEPHFGKKKLSEITTKEWKKYCHKPSTPNDLKNHRKVLNGYLKWCKENDLLEGLPDISSVPDHERRSRRIVKPDELRLIFQHCKGSLRTFLALALYNGLRRTEIMTLTWDRVDLEKRFLIVDKRFNKKRRGRSIPINGIVVGVLRQHYANQIESRIRSPWVFPHKKYPKKAADPGGLKTAWRTCLKHAGLVDITWHDFRATFEKYAHLSLAHTDTQKEKFADASMDVQKRIYVSMEHDDLQGLEDVVQVPGLPQIIYDADEGMGK